MKSEISEARAQFLDAIRKDRHLAGLLTLKEGLRSGEVEKIIGAEFEEWASRVSLLDKSKAGELLAAYRDWEPLPADMTEGIEILAPSLHALPYRLTPAGPTSLQDWINDILHICLYVDKLWIPDPAEILANELSLAIVPDIAVHNYLSNPAAAYDACAALELLDPLLREGIVEYYPPIKTYQSRIAENLFGVRRGYTEEELEGSWPALFVSEGLALAKALSASYAALLGDELEAIRSAASGINEVAGGVNGRVVAALPRLQLPFFENIDPEVLVKVRSREEAFNDFRLLLREFARTLSSDLAAPGFTKDVQHGEEDILLPAIRKLYDDIRGVTTLRQRLSDAGVDFGVVSISSLAVSGEPLMAMGAGIVGVLAKILITTIAARNKSRPAAELVYAFHSGRLPGFFL